MNSFQREVGGNFEPGQSFDSDLIYIFKTGGFLILKY